LLLHDIPAGNPNSLECAWLFQECLFIPCLYSFLIPAIYLRSKLNSLNICTFFYIFDKTERCGAIELREKSSYVNMMKMCALNKFQDLHSFSPLAIFHVPSTRKKRITLLLWTVHEFHYYKYVLYKKQVV